MAVFIAATTQGYLDTDTLNSKSLTLVRQSPECVNMCLLLWWPFEFANKVA